MPGRDEIPPTSPLAEIQVAAEYRAAAVEALARVLDVHVVDALGELLNERSRVEELVREVARVEVDPKPLPALDGVQRLASGDEVVRDLGRVHLEPEAHALGVEHVDDRVPALGEVPVSGLDLVPVVRGNE